MSNSLDFNILNKKIVKLAKILHIENKLLLKFQIKKIINMQNEKNKIISYLLEMKEKLAENKVENIDPSLIDNIKNNLKTIEKMIIENSNLTLKAINSNKKIIEIFTNHLADIDKISYTSKGIKKINNMIKPFASLKLV